MTEDRWDGDGIRLCRLLEVSCFDADYYWPDIPLLLVLGDEEGFAETGIIRPPGMACSSTGLLGLSAEIATCPISLDALVIPVCIKGSSEARSGTISVGRSHGNDVCLNHKSISKFHAQFLPPKGDIKGWRIHDCGSLNGTWVEGLRIHPDDTLTARGLADVTFGSLHCRFVQSGTLTALVRLLSETLNEKSAADTDPDVYPEDGPEATPETVPPGDPRRGEETQRSPFRLSDRDAWFPFKDL